MSSLPSLPKFAVISAATSGNNTIVAAVASKKIRVLALYGAIGSDINCYFQSGTSGAGIFGDSSNKVALTKPFAINLVFNPYGWFETAAGDLLNFNMDATGPFAGCLVYQEV